MRNGGRPSARRLDAIVDPQVSPDPNRHTPSEPFGVQNVLRCHTRCMTATRTDSLASKNRWLLVVALLLVVPGTLLSVAFGGIGLVLLLMLLVDFLLARATKSSSNRPSLGVAAQLGLAVVLAVAVGGVIAFVALLI